MKKKNGLFTRIGNKIGSIFNPVNMAKNVAMSAMGMKPKSKIRIFFDKIINFFVKFNNKLLEITDKILYLYNKYISGKIGIFLKLLKMFFSIFIVSVIKRTLNRLKEFCTKDKKRAIIYFILLYICYKIVCLVYYKISSFMVKNRNNMVVLTRIVSPEKIQKSVNCYGYLESENNLNYQSEVRGNIDKIFVKEKQLVKAGQLIMVLDSKFTANSYTSAKSILESKKLQYESIKKLYQQGLESKGNLKSMEADLESATSNFESAKKAYNGLMVYAPFDGFIDNIEKKEGSQINPGERLFSLERTNDMQVKCEVQNLNVDEINIGDRVKIFVSGNEMAYGNISVIGDSIDVYSGSRSIVINQIKGYEGFEDRIRPGVSVMIKVMANSHKNVYKISSEALEITPTGSFMVKILDVKEKKNVVGYKNVIIYDEINGIDYVEGLSNGDYVIERGHEFVDIGEKGVKYNTINQEIQSGFKNKIKSISREIKKFFIFVKNDVKNMIKVVGFNKYLNG